MPVMTPSDKAIKYAKDVISGKIDACEWVKLACKRHINDLQKAKGDWPYRYDPALANRAVTFMEKMPHIKGDWAARKMLLEFEPWQCFIECNIFGWVKKSDGMRRFRTVFELIPRKNAKSTRAAARGIYCFVADNETGAEIYSGATTEHQAHEVFRPAWLMVNKLDQLQSRFGISQAGNTKNPGTMFKMADMSKFETLIGMPGDGASPHVALIDEYHEHDTDHMVDTMQTGMGARRQPLLCVFTTAGTNLNGPCYEMQQEVQKILQGVIEDETLFGIIYTIDEGDQWDDPRSLRKANPNYGVSVYPEYLYAQLAQARRSARKQNAFRTKHLNEWLGAKTAWMNMVAWQAQKREMVMEDFKKWPCHVSVDMASKKDIVAVDITFDKMGQFFSFKKFFAPEAAAEENEKYMEFVTSGHLELTSGAMIDQEVIEDYLVELQTNYHVLDFAFDEWQADYMMTRMDKKKIEVLKFPFVKKNVSEPMKFLEAYVLDGKYFHDGNPVQTWMMGNVAVRGNRREDIFPEKARSNDERCKIDGVSAAIMSLARYVVEPEKKPKHQMFFVGG